MKSYKDTITWRERLELDFPWNIIVPTLITFFIIMGIGISIDYYTSRPTVNRDPRISEVTFDDGTSKVCDGTTLVYKSDSNSLRGTSSIAVIANSPECAKSS